jgi:hypothetical protein
VTTSGGDHLGSFGKTVETNVGDDDISASLSEGDGGLTANTTGGTRDHCTATMQRKLLDQFSG